MTTELDHPGLIWETDVGKDAPTMPRERLAGTPQQENFWGETMRGSRNIVLEARAGTGKSTSCREAMWRLVERGGRAPRIRYAAFGRAVADEFRPRCPPGVEIDTTHGFCWKQLRKAIGAKEVAADKTYQILDKLGGRDLARWKRRTVERLAGLAKNNAFDPSLPSAARVAILEDLIDQHDIEVWHNRDEIVDWTDDVLRESAASGSLADFDDMLWMTWLLGIEFPAVDFLFLDEVQDFNPVQRLLIARMNPDGRTIAVGDPFQAIFAFRGADSGSIPKLIDDLDARVMPLTVTFRCPRSHVELARELVPDFDAAEAAPDGILEYADIRAVEMTGPGDLVICRYNAPLISACLRSISCHRPAFVRGRAIGDQLTSVVRRLEGDTIPGFVRSLIRWRNDKLAVLDAREGVDDQIEQVNDQSACLDAIAQTCGSPAEIPGVIKRLFDDAGPRDRVTFSSIHRAKGSEARNVLLIEIPYAVRSDRRGPGRPLPDWQAQQRTNLRYVGLTRSLDTLKIIR